ncbi:hypothetical protein KIN20_000391 [Parelaphostrongylus tenuis]|uniref:Uncharacterized protein n=1 Tax=Parelaphostrongylus tenuis TaxID=148309 RepID=A0AAD5MDJ7_PARTN|nr:hypothetical protein KIN20_000391 [Parelaphostrongylus tenuis]
MADENSLSTAVEERLHEASNSSGMMEISLSTAVGERHPVVSNSSGMMEISLSTVVEERHPVVSNSFITIAVPSALAVQRSRERLRRRIQRHNTPQSPSRRSCAYKFGAPDGIHRREIVEIFEPRDPLPQDAVPYGTTYTLYSPVHLSNNKI